MTNNINIFNNSIPLVYSTVYKAAHAYRCWYLLEDMKSEGLYALWQAYLTYKPSKNRKFSSWAYWYVWRQVTWFIKKEKRDYAKLQEYGQFTYIGRGYEKNGKLDFLDSKAKILTPCQQIVYECMKEKDTLREMGKELGKSHEWVRQHVLKIKNILKREVRK